MNNLLAACLACAINVNTLAPHQVDKYLYYRDRAMLVNKHAVPQNRSDPELKIYKPNQLEPSALNQ